MGLEEKSASEVEDIRSALVEVPSTTDAATETMR
jgi:hypothetical protein